MRRICILPVFLVSAALLSACGSSAGDTDSPTAVSTASSSSTVQQETTAPSGGTVVSEVEDTSSLPATIDVYATVAALSSGLATTMSTGGTVRASGDTVVFVDGMGYEIPIPAPTGTIITINSVPVGDTVAVVELGSSICISVPDPSANGQYVKTEVAGSNNMMFGAPEIASSPCA